MKRGVQHLIDSHEILFERTPSVKSLIEVVPQEVEDISIITISNKPIRITLKSPIRISNEPKIDPLIITTPGLVPYSSHKAVPWNYEAEVYYHGIKQDSWIDQTVDITNIVGSRKVTRTGRIFSPYISPLTTTITPVRITVDKPSTDARGKEKMIEPARMEAFAKDITTEEPSTQEMEDILKIIRKSDYKIVELLGKTPQRFLCYLYYYVLMSILKH